MGVGKSRDFIEKLRWGLGGFMVGCSVVSGYFVGGGDRDCCVMMEEGVKEGGSNGVNGG